MNDDTVQTRPTTAVADTAKEMPLESRELKVRINTLLWEVLPGITTLFRAEEIACDVFQSIHEEWEKRNF